MEKINHKELAKKLERALDILVSKYKTKPVLEKKEYALKCANRAIELTGEYCFPKNFGWQKARQRWAVERVYQSMIVSEGRLDIARKRLIECLQDEQLQGFTLEVRINYRNCPDLENWLLNRRCQVPRHIGIKRAFYWKDGELSNSPPRQEEESY